MAGDYTRFTFHPQKDTAGVLMQQGRVLLGSDWNELVELFDRRFRAETMDIIGRAVVPRNTPDGFLIKIAGTDLSIGRGRAYVDGLLTENHGAPPLEYDSSLGETRGQQPILYSTQPYFPNPPQLPSGGPHLVFLDVWDREVTWLQDSDLIDKAVGVDTATRLQTVWQVKLLANIGQDITCSTPDSLIPGWNNIIAPSGGRLTTAASGVPTSTDPCIIPPNGGYRGTENRLYRVEIHAAGPLGAAQFKWSRDNAAVASPVTAINLAGDTLSVVRIGRDAVLRFQPGDWVEITDDVQEFAGASGDMHQVKSIDNVKLTITLTQALPAGKYDATKPERHTRVIRWDQKGIVRDPLGNVIVDVDANGGLIPVPINNSVVLEDGVQVTFTTDPANGSFHLADYWCFAARTVDASVELLDHAPPRGILHHFARLAIVTFPNSTTDCRTLWPPEQKPPDQEPVVRIIRITTGDEIVLPGTNDFELSPILLSQGLMIVCDKLLASESGGTAPPGPRPEIPAKPTCVVTVHVPHVVTLAAAPAVVGFQPIVVASTVTIQNNPGRGEGNIIWQPTSAASTWLQTSLFSGPPTVTHILVRVTVKGNFIWQLTIGEPSVYLDGEAFGRPELGRVGLRLPSGDGHRGGDFEMWFWLTRNIITP